MSRDASPIRANLRRHAQRPSRVARKIEGDGQALLLPRADGAPIEGDERYTTRETLALCTRLAGVDAFELDVAACEEAHAAEHYYRTQNNGLLAPWFGRVWCNPPYSDIEPWVERAWREILGARVKVVAMLLPATRTEQPWWQRWVEPFRDGRDPVALPDLPRTSRRWPTLTTHFLPGRIRFGVPGNPNGIGVGSPPFGCVLLVWGCGA